MKTHLVLPLLLAVFPALGFSATITDNPLGSVVDPGGAEGVDALASGSATVAAMNAVSGLRVIQDWAGISPRASDDFTDIFSLANPSLPDIRLTLNANDSATLNSGYSSADGNAAKATSEEATAGNFQVISDNTGAIKTFVTFEFGTWDGSTFTLATGTNGVRAAGMALPNYGAAFTDVTIRYRDTSGAVVSTQSFVGGATFDTSPTSANDYFTGYISTTSDLRSVEMEITVNNTDRVSGIDDFAFAVVPEPSTSALLGLAGLVVLSSSRRRR